ncbi:MAG: sigma 54-interacting transcriptional regulator [Candidatus Latescibacteria bacterium]|nr:sigma 54-interacting transcriptional regulator [Candidatus Latescibacterota bacterium]
MENPPTRQINPPSMEEDTEASAYAVPDGVFVVDREGRIISFTEAAERILGRTYEDVVGRFCEDVFEAGWCAAIRRTVETEEMHSNLNVGISTPDGARISLCGSIAPLKDVKGQTAGAVITFRDVGEMKRLLDTLCEWSVEIALERDKLDAILNSITDGVFTIGEDWRVLSFNRAAERITGTSADQAIGMHCRDVFQSDACLEFCPLKRTLDTGEPLYDMEIGIVAKDGRKIPVTVSTALLYDVNGAVIGGVATFRDLSRVKELTKALEGRYSFHNLIGKSKPMQELYDLLENVAESDATVLIQGESGTGKELVARAIHYNGSRKDRPFVGVNCAALPEPLLESELFGHEKGAFTGAARRKPGRFEWAEGGTLFLDEVAEMSPVLQAKLLRVLDQRSFERVGGTESIHVDVRIIAATNRTLMEAVAQGAFRQDLYYRLNVVSIVLPPLSERREDIPLLSDHFIHSFNAKTDKAIRGVSQEAMRVLMDYAWPGNVRELENTIEHAFVQCAGGMLSVEHLPRNLRPEPSVADAALEGGDPLVENEKVLLQRVLRNVQGHRGKTAETLGISRPTLWRKMKKHGLL